MERQAKAAVLRVDQARRQAEEAKKLEQGAFGRLGSALFRERARLERAAEAERDLVDNQANAEMEGTGHAPGWLVRLIVRVAALALAIIAACLTGEEWLVWLVLSAAVLALATLGIAHATSDTRFFWTGVALFASGLVFASVFTYLRTQQNPKLQPVGILLKQSPGKDCGRYLTGAFVAQTGIGDADRIFYGNSITEDGGFAAGRLTSVPNQATAAHGVGDLDKPYESSSSFAGTLVAIREDLEAQTGFPACR